MSSQHSGTGKANSLGIVLLVAVVFATSPAIAGEPPTEVPSGFLSTDLPPGLLTGERPVPHTDLGLDVGTYFATVGFQLGMHAAIYASAALFIAVPSQLGGYLSDKDLNTILTVVAVLAPPAMALPSSHLVYKLSTRCSDRRPAWSKVFLAGGVSSMAVIWSAALLMTNGYAATSDWSREWQVLWGPLLIMGVGSLVIPAVEVLTLRYTAVHAVAAPVVLKGGGGLAMTFTF